MMNEVTNVDFKTRKEAEAFRDAKIKEGFRAYCEEWGSFNGFFYTVTFWFPII